MLCFSKLINFKYQTYNLYKGLHIIEPDANSVEDTKRREGKLADWEEKYGERRSMLN